MLLIATAPMLFVWMLIEQCNNATMLQYTVGYNVFLLKCYNAKLCWHLFWCYNEYNAMNAYNPTLIQLYWNATMLQ